MPAPKKKVAAKRKPAAKKVTAKVSTPVKADPYKFLKTLIILLILSVMYLGYVLTYLR